MKYSIDGFFMELLIIDYGRFNQIETYFPWSDVSKITDIWFNFDSDGLIKDITLHIRIPALT